MSATGRASISAAVTTSAEPVASVSISGTVSTSTSSSSTATARVGSWKFATRVTSIAMSTFSFRTVA